MKLRLLFNCSTCDSTVRVAKLRTKNGALRLVYWEVGLALLVLGVLGEVETVLSLGWYRTSAKWWNGAEGMHGNAFLDTW
jgi:hypothetical protein